MNFQGIYKLTVTVSFIRTYEKVCKIMSKNNPNQLAPVDQKEFKRLLCKFLFCFVSNLEVYTGKKIKGEKKKKRKKR